nr:hypothetical protein 10 [bacterium]
MKPLFIAAALLLAAPSQAFTTFQCDAFSGCQSETLYNDDFGSHSIHVDPLGSTSVYGNDGAVYDCNAIGTCYRTY